MVVEAMNRNNIQFPFPLDSVIKYVISIREIVGISEIAPQAYEKGKLLESKACFYERRRKYISDKASYYNSSFETYSCWVYIFKA